MRIGPDPGGTGTQSSSSVYSNPSPKRWGSGSGPGGNRSGGSGNYYGGVDLGSNNLDGWRNAQNPNPNVPNSTNNNPGPNYTGAGSFAGGNGTAVGSLLSLEDVVNRTAGKFNPPPHSSSRTVSPTAFAQYSLTSTASAATVRELQKANQRGFIYQDLDAALSSPGSSTPWGFQFMYNPTTFSHSNAADTSVDWTNTLDVSSLLTGSQSITFTLFLNRVIDMSALRTSNYASKYATALSAADVAGIKARGTEYDLEFLYRTINGNPELGPTMDTATSDFGFLAGVPIWLRLHDNMRYKVALSNISVNHIMFSDKLVPVLTEVGLTFMRIPVPIYGNDAAVGDWYSNRNLTVPPPQTDTESPAG
jgi:hypothetical protein